jgi:flagellar basal body-associated protein FliL
VNFTGAVISQKTVQARQRFLIVAFTIAVNNVQSLSGMCMKKMQAVGTVRNALHSWLSRSTADQPMGEEHRQQQKTARISWRPGQRERLGK